MQNKSQLFLLLILSIAITSCVSKKKYRIAEDKIGQLQNDSFNCQSNLSECFIQVQKLEGDKEALKNDNTAVQNELMKVSSKSKLTIAEQAKRLKSLQDLIENQKEVMNKLKRTVADALVSFDASELSVFIKDGSVYVSLEEKLLFKSGSAVVDPKGKEALKKLSSVLNYTTDINVMIEGHTDSIPIKTAKYEDNWSLSAARALSIIRILTTENGFDPTRITAAGRSEFRPIASNSTAESRAHNRRTEIILSPNLSELYNLLDQ